MLNEYVPPGSKHPLLGICFWWKVPGTEAVADKGLCDCPLHLAAAHMHVGNLKEARVSSTTKAATHTHPSSVIGLISLDWWFSNVVVSRPL